MTFVDQDLQENMTPFYTNEKENFWKNKVMQTQNVEYFEFDLKKIEIDKIQQNLTVNTSMPGKIDYDQFETNKMFILINIRNISNIIKIQQRLSDQMYLDATEQNYSHEQMTPLNSILANSKIIYRRFQELMKQQQNQLKENNDEPNYEKAKRKNEESLKILKAIHQSGQIMWYYNQNQIQRMKIKKNEFQQRKTFARNLEEYIERVINPFEPQILSRNLKIFIAKKRNFNFNIKNDWIMYQLILFNIIQNAVKYNLFEGNIIILLDCKPQKQIKKNNQIILNDNLLKFEEEEKYIFETEIIDTGIGISEERQNMLFIPFMELKMRQNLKQVQDYNIGMGLGCSQQIVSKLGGDITVKSSNRGLTVFAFKLPVTVQSTQKEQYQQSNLSLKSSMDLLNMVDHSNTIKQNRIEAQEINKQAFQYINNLNINQSLTKLKFADIELPPENNGQMLHIMKQQNKNNNMKKKLNLSNSVELLNENEYNNNSNIKQKECKSDKQQIQRNLSFKVDIKNEINQQNVNQNQIKQPSADKFSLKNKLQLKSQKNNNNIPLNTKNNENIKNNKILKKKIWNNSQSKSMYKELLILDEKSSQSEKNEDYLQQLQNQINNDSEGEIKVNSNSKSFFFNNKHEQIAIEQEGINKLKRQNSLQQDKIILNGLAQISLKNQNSQNVFHINQQIGEMQDQEIIKNQETPLIVIRDQNIIIKKKQLMKPQNPLLKNESNIQIINKNINKDLTNEEKKQLAINILLNNHQDNLQQKIGFNLRNNNQDILEDLVINNSQDSNEQNGSLCSQEDSLVLNVVVNDFNFEEQYQYKQSQLIFMNQNVSQYFQDNESEILLEFQNQSIGQNVQENIQNNNQSIGDPFKILKINKQNQFQKQNQIQQNQILELDDDAIIQRQNQNQQSNEIIHNKDKKLIQNKQIQQIILNNLESIKEVPSQMDNDNCDISIEQKNKTKKLKSFVNSPDSQFLNKKQCNNEEEKELEMKINKQEQKIKNLKIGLISQNKLLSQISNNKLLQLPELEIPKYLDDENGCGCIPKILVVDDIEFNIIPVKMMIKENFDIDIEEASNGAIALQKYKDLFMRKCGCENRTYSLIFMDLQMPVMGGKDSSQKILNLMQEQNLNNSGSLIQKMETSIVVLSAFTDKKIKEECFEIGVKKFLNKPLHYQQLHKIMSLYYYKIKKEQYRDIFKETFNKSYASSQN